MSSIKNSFSGLFVLTIFVTAFGPFGFVSAINEDETRGGTPTLCDLGGEYDSQPCSGPHTNPMNAKEIWENEICESATFTSYTSLILCLVPLTEEFSGTNQSCEAFYPLGPLFPPIECGGIGANIEVVEESNCTEWINTICIGIE